MPRPKMTKILLIDDEILCCETLQDILFTEGYEVITALHGEAALQELKKGIFQVAIIDINLPDISGLDILKAIKSANLETCAIMLTGFATLESSIKALNEGAFAYITKPYNIEEVKAVVRNGLEQLRLTQENKRLLQTLKKNNQQLINATGQLENFTHELESMVEKRTIELAREKAKNEQIIKTIADGLCTIDQDLTITTFNRTAEKITGYSSQDALKMKCYQVFKTEVCSTEQCFIKQLIKKGQPLINREVTIYDRNNQPIPTLFSMDILRDDQGKVIGSVKTFQDISGLRKMQDELTRTNQELVDNQIKLKEAYHCLHDSKEELDQWAQELDRKVQQRTRELQEANERLQELAAFKSEFLAMVSHELKTPLTAIIGYSAYLQNMSSVESQNSELNDGLMRISRNGYLLLDLIDKLLEFSKIEVGKMSVDLEPFDLREVIDDVLLITTPMANDKKIQLTFQPEDFHEHIEADRRKIKQVLLNLINNAIKFSDKPHSKILLQVKLQDKIIRISISDQGIGIDPKDQEIIFERFCQLDSSLSRKVGGVGLGLSIVKNFIDIHSGKIWVESEPRKGSTFIFEIPKNQPLHP